MLGERETLGETFRARQASPHTLGSDYMHGFPQDSLRDSFFTRDAKNVAILRKSGERGIYSDIWRWSNENLWVILSHSVVEMLKKYYSNMVKSIVDTLSSPSNLHSLGYYLFGNECLHVQDAILQTLSLSRWEKFHENEIFLLGSIIRHQCHRACSLYKTGVAAPTRMCHKCNGWKEEKRERRVGNPWMKSFFKPALCFSLYLLPTLHCLSLWCSRWK